MASRLPELVQIRNAVPERLPPRCNCSQFVRRTPRARPSAVHSPAYGMTTSSRAPAHPSSRRDLLYVTPDVNTYSSVIPFTNDAGSAILTNEEGRPVMPFFCISQADS